MAHDPEHCREVFAILSEYLDLELPPESCAEVERHLAGCAPCVEFVESLRKSVALCRSYESGVTPAPLTAEARTELQGAWRRMLEKKAETHSPPARSGSST